MRSIGGGIFITIGAIAGALVGLGVGEPSAGLLIGVGAGALAALAVARWDAWRRRGPRGMNGTL